jgi:hypothetical protein
VCHSRDSQSRLYTSLIKARRFQRPKSRPRQCETDRRAQRKRWPWRFTLQRARHRGTICFMRWSIKGAPSYECHFDLKAALFCLPHWESVAPRNKGSIGEKEVSIDGPRFCVLQSAVVTECLSSLGVAGAIGYSRPKPSPSFPQVFLKVFGTVDQDSEALECTETGE